MGNLNYQLTGEEVIMAYTGLSVYMGSLMQEQKTGLATPEQKTELSVMIGALKNMTDKLDEVIFKGGI